MENGITVERLFEGLDVEIFGNKQLKIKGLSTHSNFVVPGNLFIAKRGRTFDATEFVKKASASGAAAILTDLHDPFLKGSAQIIHPDPALIEPEIANRFFGFPSKELFLIGVTGTNGKTTTVHLIAHILDGCGLMGTVEIRMGQICVPSYLTTNEIVISQKYLREMRFHGIENSVMEVSSHALDQNRVRGLDFNMGIFTNFSQDHLDYHGTMNHYLDAKSKLFDLLETKEKIAILNRDDPNALHVVKKCRGKVVTFGIKNRADYRAKNLIFSMKGTRFTLTFEGQEVEMKTGLIGHFNVLNTLAAVAACHQRGLSFEQIQNRIKSFPGVPGRCERVPNSRGINLFVDFAHTPHALEQVLTTLTSFKSKQMITVFGCGGDRDRLKRSEMGSVAEVFSDQVIVTSDNPRTEEPLAICKQIAKGIKFEKVSIEVDRRLAILKAISVAKRGDVVLIAGRGNESHQKIQNRLIPFDDRKVADEICNHSD